MSSWQITHNHFDSSRKKFLLQTLSKDQKINKIFALVTWSSSSPSPKKFFSKKILLVQNYFCSKISGLIFNLTDLYWTNWSCFFATRADDCLALTDTDLITHCFLDPFDENGPNFFYPPGNVFGQIFGSNLPLVLLIDP